EEKPAGFRVSYSVLASIVVHTLIAVYLIRNYKPVSSHDLSVPIQHYVELIKSDPRQFTEAPGKTAEHAPLNAPLSNANRKAAMPEPTGDKPTQQPGEGGIYTPPAARSSPRRPSAAQEAAAMPPQSARQQKSAAAPEQPAQASPSFAYHQQAQASAAAA